MKSKGLSCILSRFFFSLIVLSFTFSTVGHAQTGNLLPPAAVVKQMPALMNAAMQTFATGAHEEFSFVYNTQGNPGSVNASKGPNASHQLIYANTAGIVHTHPFDEGSRPSPADCYIAKKAHVRNYVLTQNELWVAMPDGKAYRVGAIAVKDGVLTIEATQ